MAENRFHLLAKCLDSLSQKCTCRPSKFSTALSSETPAASAARIVDSRSYVGFEKKELKDKAALEDQRICCYQEPAGRRCQTNSMVWILPFTRVGGVTNTI